MSFVWSLNLCFIVIDVFTIDILRENGNLTFEAYEPITPLTNIAKLLLLITSKSGSASPFIFTCKVFICYDYVVYYILLVELWRGRPNIGVNLLGLDPIIKLCKRKVVVML